MLCCVDMWLLNAMYVHRIGWALSNLLMYLIGAFIIFSTTSILDKFDQDATVSLNKSEEKMLCLHFINSPEYLLNYCK